MPIFRDIVIHFRGADYTVTPSLRLMRSIEGEGISLAEIGTRVMAGKMPLSLVATVLHRMLATAGCAASEDEVYAEMMGGDVDRLKRLTDHVLYAFMPQEDAGKNPDAPPAS